MAYIGKVPTAVPLSGADLEDSIITSAKITDGTIALADLSATGTKDATTFLRGDNTFAEAGGGGKVLQVVQGTHTSQVTTTSTSFVDVSTNTNVSLTCASTSNKVLITANFHELYANGSQGFNLRVTAGGTEIMRATNLLIGINGEKNWNQTLGPFLYSPNSTSSIEYKMQFASNNGSEVRVNQHSTKHVALTLIEIGS